MSVRFDPKEMRVALAHRNISRNKLSLLSGVSRATVGRAVMGYGVSAETAAKLTEILNANEQEKESTTISIH